MIPQNTFYDEVVNELSKGRVANKDSLQRLKAKLSRIHGLRYVPSDADVIRNTASHIPKELQNILRVKPSRTASGVAVISVMTAPHSCPHGTCIYCPGGPDFGTPKSYTGREPAAMRAAQHHFDPYGQTRSRLQQLREMGHSTDKVDLIIIGGTFTNLEEGYREWFVKSCLDALNGFISASLEEAQRANETSQARCIGLTMETKPDWFIGREVEHSLALGVTRVELGVQNTHDDVLKLVNRGHTDFHTRAATRRARDAGLKLCYHMMPGLPSSDFDRDLESFRRIFEDPEYRPDMLKIYPTLVLEHTGLHKLWMEGKYRPLETDEAVKLIADVKKLIPPYVRIQRIQREIEVPSVRAGLKKGNVRELARRRLAEEGLRCRCIRCREVGLSYRTPKELKLLRMDYEASGGHEVFLSYEDDANDVLVAYARLRDCDFGPFLRELKVFGQVVAFGEEPGDRWQHRGLGASLLSECERLCIEEFDRNRLLITSGVGVRQYYRRLGYNGLGPYMARDLT